MCSLMTKSKTLRAIAVIPDLSRIKQETEIRKERERVLKQKSERETETETENRKKKDISERERKLSQRILLKKKKIYKTCYHIYI